VIKTAIRIFMMNSSPIRSHHSQGYFGFRGNAASVTLAVEDIY
jgi:hypothetical protein